MKEEAVLDIAVEFPQEREIVTTSRYIFRIWAADAREVSASIDGGPWQTCRSEDGYWWLEWNGYANGSHWVAARMRDGEGRYLLARPQRFQVDLSEPGNSEGAG